MYLMGHRRGHMYGSVRRYQQHVTDAQSFQVLHRLFEAVPLGNCAEVQRDRWVAASYPVAGYFDVIHPGMFRHQGVDRLGPGAVGHGPTGRCGSPRARSGAQWPG